MKSLVFVSYIKRVALVSLFALGSTNAFADRINGVTIHFMYPNSSTNVDVWVDGSINGKSTGQIGLTLSGADPGFKAMYAALLSARVSDRKIEIDIVSQSEKRIVGVIF